MPYASIGDAEIYYEEAGTGEPLLLASGLGGTGDFWNKVKPYFAEFFQVITFDHRGCGKSSKSDIEYTVNTMTLDAIQFMDALGIETCHFVGHSTGGAMGQIAAQDFASRLKTLTLSATWAGYDAYFQRCFEIRQELLKVNGFETYTKASNLYLWPSYWISENEAALTAREAKAVSHPSIPVHILERRLAALRAFDRRARIREISCPTLVISARDDMLTPLHLSAELAQKIDSAQWETLERGGHFAPIVEAEDFAKRVLGFLKQ